MPRDAAELVSKSVSPQAIAMWVFWIGFSVLIYLDQFFVGRENEDAWYAISSIVTSLLMFTWFLYDARSIGVKPSLGLKIAVLAVGFVALPYYLFRYKGPKRAGVSLLRFAAFAGAFLTFAYFVVP